MEQAGNYAVVYDSVSMTPLPGLPLFGIDQVLPDGGERGFDSAADAASHFVAWHESEHGDLRAAAEHGRGDPNQWADLALAAWRTALAAEVAT